MAAILIAASSSGCYSAEFTETLEPVTVTATMVDCLMVETPTSISVIDSDTIEQLGAISIDQILEEVPGLVVEMNSGRISRPAIRGTNSAQTLLLIDGRRQAPGFKRMSDLNQILVGGIERVEVVRGPVSSLYGSEAIGGVVNIITKKSASGDAEGSINTYYGTGKFDEYAASLSGGIRHSGIDVYGSVGTRYNEEYESGNGAPSDFDEVRLLGGLINAGGDLTDSTKLSGSVIFTDTEREGMRTQQGGSLRNAKDKRTGTHLQLDQKLGDSTRAMIRGYVEQYDCDISMTSSKETTYSDMRNRLSVLDGYLASDLTDSLGLVVGGELRQESYDDFSDNQRKDDIDNRAAYAQINWAPMIPFNIVGGGRIDHYEKFGSRISPQISGLYMLSDSWSLRTGFGHGFRAPNSMELSIETVENQGKTTVLPNADLDPEKSRTFEIGLRRSSHFWTFGLTAFRTKVEDMIETTTVSKNVVQWNNIRSVSIDGIEIENALHFTRNLSLDHFLCWLDPVDDNTGLEVEGKQRWISQLSVVGKIPQFGISGRVSLRIGSDEWGPDGTKTDYDETVDLRLEKSFNEHLKIYLGGRNLTSSYSGDRRYYGGITTRF